MITDKTLTARDLDQVYDWIDSLALSKPKKNIGRDFSDATMMAQVIHQQFPKLIELHNYPPTNALKSKLANWTTLNNKVLTRLGIGLSPQDCRRLSSSTPLAIEPLLHEYKSIVDENHKEANEEQRRRDNSATKDRERDVQGIGSKLYTASKAQQLKEVLFLLKEKITLTERSIERKDAHIRELEDILRQYGN